MSDVSVLDQYAELYKERRDRIARITLALIAMLAVCSVDAANRFVTHYETAPRAQLALYKYCKEYNTELVRWEKARSGKTRVKSITIRFGDTSFRQGKLPAGWVDKSNLPLMTAYLQETKLLKVGDETRPFFGYQISFPVYLLAVVVTPGILLCIIFYNAAQMRVLYGHMESYIHDQESEDEMVPHLPISVNAFVFSRVTTMKREQWKPYVRRTCFLLFLLATSILGAVLWLQRWPVVEGTLHVQPLLPPDITLGSELPYLNSPLIVKIIVVIVGLHAWFCTRIYLVLVAEESEREMPLFHPCMADWKRLKNWLLCVFRRQIESDDDLISD